MVNESKLKIIDYGQSHCIPCGGWCCYNESPYLGKKDSQLIGNNKLNQLADGSCEYFKDGICTIYKIRPFECIIFPFDILLIEANFTWVLWESCPANVVVDPDSYMQLYEEELLKNLEANFLSQYVDYHLANQPKKYSAHKFKILRKVNI